MSKKGFAPEQVINKLREGEVLLGQGSTVAQASGKIALTDQTYKRWCEITLAYG